MIKEVNIMNWRAAGLAVILIFFLCVLENIAGIKIDMKTALIQGAIFGLCCNALLPIKKKVE
jgi:hypothetical protein